MQRIILLLALTGLAITRNVETCPKCKGEGGFGVKGGLFGLGWSPCKECNGSGVRPKR